MMPGLFVNVGSFRPRWFKKGQLCQVLHFEFSVEVPLEEEGATEDELRVMVQESIAVWSRRCYRRVQKRLKERRVKRGRD